MTGGNITIEGLRRTDFGFYQCVASNEVATIVTATQLVVEGTQPHAPYNVSGNASEFAVTLQWLPGYSGGPDYKQDYTIWLAELTWILFVNNRTKVFKILFKILLIYILYTQHTSLMIIHSLTPKSSGVSKQAHGSCVGNWFIPEFLIPRQEQ